MKIKQKKSNPIHEPIIWDESNKKASLEDFLYISQGLGMTHVIYVQAADSSNKSIWSCTKEQLVGCFSTFSAKAYFGRIQPLDLAIEYGFDDEEFTTNRLKDNTYE